MNKLISESTHSESKHSESKHSESKHPESKHPESKDLDNIELGSLSASSPNVEWSKENEMIMVEWCDIAQCYKWLSSKAHSKYSMMHAWMTIPAITLSTISGTASFAQASLPLNYQTFAPMVIGSINIFIGILTTIQQYLKISELNEGHRVAAIAWDKFARNIRIELAKAPLERMDAGQFLKISRQEFDRLMETSPTVPQDIINLFSATFAGKEGSVERSRYDELKKPDICNIIESASKNRHPWYLEAEKSSNNSLQNLALSLNQKQEKLREREAEILEKEKELSEKDEKRLEIQKTFQKSVKAYTAKVNTDKKQIDDYIASYNQIYGRKPLPEDISAKFNDTVEDDIIQDYLKLYTTTLPSDNNV